MSDLPLLSFSFLTMCAGVFFAILSLPRNYWKFSLRVKNQLYSMTNTALMNDYRSRKDFLWMTVIQVVVY